MRYVGFAVVLFLLLIAGISFLYVKNIQDTSSSSSTLLSPSDEELSSRGNFLLPQKSVVPIFEPNAIPSFEPSAEPTSTHSLVPSDGPSMYPSIFPSAEPSLQPTNIHCPVNFTLDLLTDKYPGETSWTLTNIFSNAVIGEAFNYQNDFEIHEESVCLWYDNCYMFEIRDQWDDGMCCGNGQGSFAGFLEYTDSRGRTTELVPIPGLNGGAFTDAEQHKFCLDSNGELAEEEGIEKAVGRIKGRISTQTPTQTPTLSTKIPTPSPIRHINKRNKELMDDEEQSSLMIKGHHGRE